MKCPKCKYTHGHDETTQRIIDGEHGDFYKSTDQLHRRIITPTMGDTIDSQYIYGCPSCGHIFIEVEHGL